MTESLFVGGIPVDPRSQFRLVEKIIKDWGTFSGVHRLAIAPEGHLILGENGVGKTTLLDAHATTLIRPGLIGYNVAAQDDGKKRSDRTLEDYLRGAFSDESSGGEVHTRYLRGDHTWSIFIDTYENGYGEIITLAQILIMRGENTATQRRFLIMERRLAIEELASLPKEGFEIRRLKAMLPEALVTGDFNEYLHRAMTKFEIESEQAIKLLYKTMSAKNVDSLAAFIRENMLDYPETFDLADKFVAGCQSLDEAHEVMVTARRQIEHLRSLRDIVEVQRKISAALALNARHQNQLSPYLARKQIEAISRRLIEDRMAQDGLIQQINIQETNKRQQKYILDGLHSSLANGPGSHLDAMTHEVEHLEKDELPHREKARNLVAQASRELGFTAPTDHADYEQLKQKVSAISVSIKENITRNQDKLSEIGEQAAGPKQRLAIIEQDIELARSQRSSIPSELLRIRQLICADCNIERKRLPFLGELIDVLNAEEDWRYAIERVLGSRACQLLVPEDLYQSITDYLHTNNIGGRIKPLRMAAHEGSSPRPFTEKSMIYDKLEFKSCPERLWVRQELERNAAYVCVDAAIDLRREDRAVTKTGLIKHNRYSHEKNDRRLERHAYVIGFDSERRIALLEVEAKKHIATLTSLQQEQLAIKQGLQEDGDRKISAETIVTSDWSLIDTGSLLSHLQDLKQQIRSFRAEHKDIDERKKEYDAQYEVVEAIENDIIDLNSKLSIKRENITQNERLISDLEGVSATCALSQEEAIAFEQLITTWKIPMVNLAPTSYQTVESRIRAKIDEERKSIEAKKRECEGRIIESIMTFRSTWRVDAANIVDHSFIDASQYLMLLDELEMEGLPQAEERFVQHIQRQGHQNLMLLASAIRTARNGIRERLGSVNTVLKKSCYGIRNNQPTYIQLHTEILQLKEVQRFEGMVQEALNELASRDPRQAEIQYDVIRQIVTMFSSSDSLARNERQRILDVRLQVDFIVREYDTEEHEVQVYLGGGGKSGGQRQKLAATILAAALCYQFGGPEMRLPRYTTVMMDEAFSKSDAAFTATILEIFKNFGFQMVLSTPMKGVQVYEPYVRGATYVYINDEGTKSSTKHISYRLDEGRLDVPQAKEALDAVSS